MILQTRLLVLLGFLLVLVASNWYSYSAGNTHGSNAILVGTLRDTNETLLKRIAANEEEASRLAQIAIQASIDHAKEIEDIRNTERAAANKRVRLHASICTPAPRAQTAEAGGAEQADTGAAFLPEGFTERVRQLAATADEVAADLRNLKRRVEEAECFAE